MTKTLKKIIGGSLIGLLVPAFLFWWYEWRPHEIRQECLATANEQVRGTPVAVGNADVIRVYYEMCLHARGLDK